MSEKAVIDVNQPEKPKEAGIGSWSDLGVGFVDSAVARPYNATLGLVLPKIDLSESYNRETVAARIGDFGGTVADFVVLSKVTGGLVNKGLGTAAERGLISRSLKRRDSRLRHLQHAGCNVNSAGQIPISRAARQ